MNKRQLIADFLAKSPGFYVIRVDLQGRYTYVNPYFQEKFSFLAADFIGLPSENSIFKGDLPKTAEAAQSCLNNPGSIVPVEIHKPDLKGGFFLSYWEFSAITDDTTNQPKEVLCLGFDITERENAKYNLQNLSYTLNDIWEQAQVAVMHVTPTGTIERINKAALTLFQQPAVPVVVTTETNLAQIFPNTLIGETLQAVINNQEAKLLELHAPRLESWLKVLFYPTPAGCTLYCFDITPQKKAQEKLSETKRKLKAALNYQQNAFILLSPDLRIKAFSQATADAIKQYFKREVHEGESYLTYLVPEFKDAFIKNFTKALEGQVVSSERAIPISKDQAVWHLITYYPVFDEAEAIAGVAFTATNIDALKRSTNMVMDQQEKLEKISLLQSHQVRGPVATILGLCNLIDKNQLSEENKTYLELIETTGKRLDQTIHTIVDEAIARQDTT